MIDSGLVLCGGSDSDVNEMNPILAIHSAVNHPKKNHSVEVVEALEMFTVNSAFASFEDHLKGNIEKGKYCDLAVLDQDILTVDKDRIKDIEVVATLKEGNIVFCREDYDMRGDGNGKV